MMARLCLIVPFLFATVTSAGKADSWIDTFRKDHIRFYFFNKNTSQPDGYQISKDFQTEDILASGFKPEYPSKVIIPGWNSGVTNPLIQQLKNAYIDNNGGTDLNIIIVDWSDLSYFGFGNINGVGKRSAELLDFMVGTGLLNVEHVHIIGMSESAHIAGVTGEFISSGRVARITGLDPSRPFIDMTKKRGRLSVDDADLVDVVHTNAGTLGEQSAVGHIDFYPNGGKKQPGCENEFIGSCSHERAVLLFVESINSPHAFQAWRCENEWAALHDRCQISDTLATMGEHLSYRVNGSYLLKTTGSSPFER